MQMKFINHFEFITQAFKLSLGKTIFFVISSTIFSLKQIKFKNDLIFQINKIVNFTLYT